MLFHCGRAIPAESNRSQTPYSGTTTPTWLQVPLHGLLPGFEPDGIRRMESRFQITGILASSQQKTREAQAGQSSKGWRILTRFFEIVAHFAVASGFQLQVGGLAPLAARYAGFSSRKALWTALMAGKSGVSTTSIMPADRQPMKYAAEARELR